MTLNITRINQDAPRPKVAADQRLYRTAEGKRLVPEGHADAAFLFCAPGQEVDAEAFAAFELDVTDVVSGEKVDRAAEAEGETAVPAGDEEDTEEKAAKPKADKRRKTETEDK